MRLFKSNYPWVSNVTISHDDDSISVAGQVEWTKDTVTARGYCYKAASSSEWTFVPATSGTVSATISSLTEHTEYDVAFYAQYNGVKYISQKQRVLTDYTDPSFTTPTTSSVTSSGMTVASTATYSGEAEYGIAWKKGTGAYTHVKGTGKSISVTLTELDANTEYTLAAYAKIGSTYKYSTTKKQKTAA